MKPILMVIPFLVASSCMMSTESDVRSYNGDTVEMTLYGDTFSFGSDEQKQAQIEAARVKAAKVCGGNARYLSRRVAHQPQNGIYYVPAENIALFQCV